MCTSNSWRVWSCFASMTRDARVDGGAASSVLVEPTLEEESSWMRHIERCPGPGVASSGTLLDCRLDRRNDVLRRDAEAVEQFLRLAAPWHLADRKFAHDALLGGKGFKDCVADTAMLVMIFDRNDVAVALAC